MTLMRTIVGILSAAFCLAIGANAQVVAYTDTTGKRIYINGDSPKARSGSTIKTSAPRQQAATPSPATAISPPLETISTAAPDGRLERIVQAAAARHQVDPALVKAVINTESGWNSRAVSRKGAMGLMQLIPGTAERFGVGNPYDPAQNIEGGTTYLRSLLDRYNGDLSKSLAAYNAGEGAVDRSGGVPWFPETRRYVRKVTDAYFRPDSGHDLRLLSSPPPAASRVRTEVDDKGRVIFTNE